LSLLIVGVSEGFIDLQQS